MRWIDTMMVGSLQMPKRLLALIDSGLWPRNEAEANRQNLKSLVPKERIQLFAPEGISPDLSVFIGDFGLGSDAPILLDYREDRSNPAVIRLKVNPLFGETMPNDRKRVTGWANVWLRCADTFDAFADLLGLEQQISS